MKKLFKILSMVLTGIIIFFSLTACETGASGDGQETTANEKNKLKIKDIAWTVEESVVDGKRYAVLNLTNNTKYVITEFDIEFKEKSDITEEEKNAFYNDAKTMFDIGDEDLEELKAQEISMHVDSDRVINPGDSVSNIRCLYYSGFHYVTNFNHYHLVTPDIATIKYVDNGLIYTTYYDFNSKKFSTDSDTEVALYWTKNNIGNLIPKPDSSVVKKHIDDEYMFMFDAFEVSLDQFNSYVDKCKNLGYVINSSGFEGYYSADSDKGYNIHLSYDGESLSMGVTVSANNDSN